MSSMTEAEKRIALATLPNHYENRLFFAARNLAIEALLLRLETTFSRKGIPVKAEWQESSHPPVSIAITLKNPKPADADEEFEYYQANVRLNRETIAVPQDKASACFYTLNRVEATQYWPYKISKYIAGFIEAVEALAADGYFAREVLKVNYPFEYDHHSAF